MKRIILSLLLCVGCGYAAAQDVIDLSGTWQLQSRLAATTMTLPGSTLTNGIGDEVTVSTRWTGSLYDSSYYFNPYMERYRKAGQMKFPFFLTPARHFVGEATYSRIVSIPRT